MRLPAVVAVLLSVYLGLNFLCALLLHLHARRQAHLPLRFLDVAVHFALLTLFAIPALLVVTLTAIFGGGGEALAKPANSAPTARAA